MSLLAHRLVRLLYGGLLGIIFSVIGIYIPALAKSPSPVNQPYVLLPPIAPLAADTNVVLTPNHSRYVPPDSVFTHTHILTNIGHTTDTFNLEISPGWATLVVSSPITLARNETETIRVRLDVPRPAHDQQQHLTLITATSQTTPTLYATAIDTTTVQSPVFESHMTVTGSPATHNGVLTYSLVFTNLGSGVATNTLVYLPLPTDTTFVPASAEASSDLITPAIDGTLSNWSLLSDTLNTGRTGHGVVKIGRPSLLWGEAIGGYPVYLTNTIPSNAPQSPLIPLLAPGRCCNRQ